MVRAGGPSLSNISGFSALGEAYQSFAVAMLC